MSAMMRSLDLAVGADVAEEVEVGVEQVAATRVELLDVAVRQGDLDALRGAPRSRVPAERIDHGGGVPVDVGQRQLPGRDVVHVVLERLVVEHQDLLDLDAQQVGVRRVDGDTAGRGYPAGYSWELRLLWVMPPGRSSGRGGPEFNW